MQPENESLQQAAQLLKMGAAAGAEYLAALADRNVAPDVDALAALEEFNTSLPESPCDQKQL